MYRQFKTELEAVEEALKLWEHLKNTGSKTKNTYLPDIQNEFLSGCPLCSWYLEQNPADKQVQSLKGRNYRSGCRKCPLGKDELCKFAQPGSVYALWDDCYDSDRRKKYASELYAAIKVKQVNLYAKMRK